MGNEASTVEKRIGSQNPALIALIRLLAEIVADELLAEQRADLIALPSPAKQCEQTVPLYNNSKGTGDGVGLSL